MARTHLVPVLPRRLTNASQRPRREAPSASVPSPGSHGRATRTARGLAPASAFPGLDPTGVYGSKSSNGLSLPPSSRGPGPRSLKQHPSVTPTPFPPAAPTPPWLAGSASERGWGGVERSLCPAGAPSPGANPVPRTRRLPRGRPPCPAWHRQAGLPSCSPGEGRARSGGKVPLGPGRSALSSSAESLRAGASVRARSARGQAAWEPAQHAACGGHAPARAHTHPHVAHEGQAPWDAARLPHTAQAPHSRGRQKPPSGMFTIEAPAAL